MNPEEKARFVIDQKLMQSGWVLQDMKEFNPAANLGIAVRSYPTDTGPVDYLLFIEKKAVGVIEAKKSEEAEKITIHEKQSNRYATSALKWVKISESLRFIYEATDIITRFTDYKDEKACSRDVFSFHTPETLLSFIKDGSTLRNRLKADKPLLNTEGFRDCQIRAIQNLEVSFAQNKPRALIQMATGAGKTFTAITAVYRLLKFAKAKRILFLVDTKNLGEQAEQEFIGYAPNDDHRLFSELYNVSRLNSSNIPKDAHVCISTIQRMYSILKGVELDESSEEQSLNEVKITGSPKEVVYSHRYPPEFFDFIIIDECHRSIYNIWQQVLDYFDAFLIGLTATPDKRTFAFFNENVVSEYSHEEAVIDGVNVGFDVYTIETQITKKGSYIARQCIERRNRLTRQKRWEELDEDIVYSASQLDRDVVNPSQIRHIIKAFKGKVLTEIFPNRKEVPKTLIFAKTDSHADDIIQMVRMEFGEGSEFCKKITYQTKDNPKSLLSSFRNDYYPRIAVTVDMIATGTDVKPIECLLFMRDVRSKNYFEQMKGRGTRTLQKDDLQKVSPSAQSNKTHFVIVDAIGVCSSLKTDSRPLERKPTVSLKDLMLNVVMGNQDEDILTSLANRLTRLDKQLSQKEKEKFIKIADGKTITQIVKDLLDSFDPDVIEEQAKIIYQITDARKITDDQREMVQKTLIEKAAEPFYSPELREYIEDLRKTHDQIIDVVNLDKITTIGWNVDHKEKAKGIIGTFREFIENNKDEITALGIIYNQVYTKRQITLDMVKELYDKLKKSPYNLTYERLWEAYYTKEPTKVKSVNAVRMLTDIVALIRFELGIEIELIPYADIINRNFKEWVFRKNAGKGQFTEEQMNWLRMIKDHMITSMCVTRETLQFTPFSENGGLGRFYQLFGVDYEEILAEINVALVA